MFNAFADDVAQTFNTVQPVVYGGTGVNDGRPLDNVFGVKNASDLTKIGVFNAAGIATGTTRTFDLPNANGALMLTTTPLTNAQALNGSVVTSAYGQYVNNTDLTSVIPFDDTPPRWDEGVNIITVQITPQSTTNKIRIRFKCEASVSVLGVAAAALFINQTGAASTAVRTVFTTIPTGGYGGVLAMEYEYTPGTTSLQNIDIRVGPNTGTLRLNGNTSARVFGGTMGATLVAEEIKA